MNKEKNWRRLAGRILSMVLSLLLVFSFAGSIVNIDAFAEGGNKATRDGEDETYVSGDYEYEVITIDYEKYAKITGYNGNVSNLMLGSGDFNHSGSGEKRQ